MEIYKKQWVSPPEQPKYLFSNIFPFGLFFYGRGLQHTSQMKLIQKYAGCFLGKKIEERERDVPALVFQH